MMECPSEIFGGFAGGGKVTTIREHLRTFMTDEEIDEGIRVSVESSSAVEGIHYKISKEVLDMPKKPSYPKPKGPKGK